MSALISDNPPQIHPQIFCKYKKKQTTNNPKTKPPGKRGGKVTCLRLGLNCNCPHFFRARSSGFPAKPSSLQPTDTSQVVLHAPVGFSPTAQLLLATGSGSSHPRSLKSVPARPLREHHDPTTQPLQQRLSALPIQVVFQGQVIISQAIHSTVMSRAWQRSQPRDGVWDH